MDCHFVPLKSRFLGGLPCGLAKCRSGDYPGLNAPMPYCRLGDKRTSCCPSPITGSGICGGLSGKSHDSFVQGFFSNSDVSGIREMYEYVGTDDTGCC